MHLSRTVKTTSGLAAGLLGALMSGSALAADRIGASQAKYLGGLAEGFILVLTSVMFLVSLAVILIAGWFLIRDYVMKDDREKRFSFAQLVVAMIVAGILGFPAGAYIVGQDLLSGDEGGAKVEQKLFERAKK